MKLYKKIGFISGLALLILILILPSPEGLPPSAKKMAAVVCLMGAWWVTEAIPIAATALVPIVLFPLFGIMPASEVTPLYSNSKIYLFMGGFFLAVCMENWGLSKRIALFIIKNISRTPDKIILGFMTATAFISMWISNTATTIMMLPIGIAVISKISEINKFEENDKIITDFGSALMLGIAYSASIGGIGTLIGTPPNIIFAGVVTKLYPNAPEISFFRWMLFGIPLVLVFLPVVWMYLTRISHKITKDIFTIEDAVIDDEYNNLPKMNRGEKSVAVIFLSAVFLWVFRSDIVLGSFKIPGWSSLFANPGWIDDSTVAILMALCCFIIPISIEKGAMLLDWKSAKRIPWGILILFGGGFALASGFSTTGLSDWFGNRLAILHYLPVLLAISIVCLFLTFLTEVTSNTATTSMILPILASTAVAMSINPFILMIPATVSASCAFMLPVATPPNAIIFASGRITIPKMAKVGVILNFIGVIFVTLLVYFLAFKVFGISLEILPDWI